MTISTTYSLTGKHTCVYPEGKSYSAIFQQTAPPAGGNEPETLRRVKWMGMSKPGELTITGLEQEILEQLEPGEYTITITKTA